MSETKIETCTHCGSESKNHFIGSVQMACGSVYANNGSELYEGFQCFRNRIAAAQARIAELESHLNTLTGYVTTCQSDNRYGWLERLLEHINKSCELLNDPDRFRAIECGGQMHFKKVTNSGPAAERGDDA